MDEAEKAGTHTFPRKKPIVRPQRNPLEWRANLTQLRREDGGAIDGTNVDELTRGELIGRQQALDAFTFIRDRTPAPSSSAGNATRGGSTSSRSESSCPAASATCT
jgi:hypothetical protein